MTRWSSLLRRPVSSWNLWISCSASSSVVMRRETLRTQGPKSRPLALHRCLGPNQLEVTKDPSPVAARDSVSLEGFLPRAVVLLKEGSILRAREAPPGRPRHSAGLISAFFLGWGDGHAIAPLGRQGRGRRSFELGGVFFAGLRPGAA